MKTYNWKIVFLLPIFLIGLTLATAARAQEYDIPWWTIDGGGGIGLGGNYSLSGSISQPDTGVLSGGAYTLIGGFWGIGVQQLLYLPLILND